jgi:hypothetical protein
MHTFSNYELRDSNSAGAALLLQQVYTAYTPPHSYAYTVAVIQALKRARLRDHEERVALSGECDAAKKRVAAAARLRGLCVTRHRYLAWVGRQDNWEVSSVNFMYLSCYIYTQYMLLMKAIM